MNKVDRIRYTLLGELNCLHCLFGGKMSQLAEPRIECRFSLVEKYNSIDHNCFKFSRASNKEVSERKYYKDKADRRKAEFKELNDL